MKKITLCGEYYSPNFGDCLIVSACKYVLETLGDSNEIEIMDFSCRTRFSDAHSNLEYKDTDIYRNLIKISQRIKLFSNLYTILKWAVKSRKNYYKYYSEKLRNTNILIFAGGQILMNNSLDYPLRLNMINKIAAKYGIEVIFSSCGSEKTDDFFAKLLLKRVLGSKNVKIISVRDDVKNIIHLLGDKDSQSKHIYESNDPATVIANAYGINKKDSNIIGLGVISHLAYVSAHSRSNNNYLISENELIAKWISIVREIKSRGYECELFSNGGYHDNAMLYKLKRALDGEVTTFIPATPYELVNEVSGFRSVIAHRLHAGIIAYSLKIPSVGVVWDEKLIEFAKKTDRMKYYINLKEYNAAEVVDLVENAIDEGIDEVLHTKITQETRNDLENKILISQNKSNEDIGVRINEKNCSDFNVNNSIN